MAIALNPGHCRAYYNRAFSYDRLGHFEEAVADYSKALQIEPSNATALHNRGSLFERLGRCDECRDCSQLGFISQSVSATAPASCHRLQCSTWIAKDVEVPYFQAQKLMCPLFALSPTGFKMPCKTSTQPSPQIPQQLLASTAEPCC